MHKKIKKSSKKIEKRSKFIKKDQFTYFTPQKRSFHVKNEAKKDQSPSKKIENDLKRAKMDTLGTPYFLPLLNFTQKITNDVSTSISTVQILLKL